MIKWLKKLDAYLKNAIYVIGGIGLLITVGCTAFNIVSLWVSGKRYSQLDEFALLALVWVVYAGMGLLYSNGQHVTMDFIVNCLPERGKKISRIINNIVIIIICAITAYFSWKLSIKSFAKRLNITKIPYFYCDIIVFVGYVHLLILAAADTVKTVLELAGKKGE